MTAKDLNCDVIVLPIQESSTCFTCVQFVIFIYSSKTIKLLLSINIMLCLQIVPFFESLSVPYSIIQKATNALEVLKDVLDAVDTQHPEV